MADLVPASDLARGDDRREVCPARRREAHPVVSAALARLLDEHVREQDRQRWAAARGVRP